MIAFVALHTIHPAEIGRRWYDEGESWSIPDYGWRFADNIFNIFAKDLVRSRIVPMRLRTLARRILPRR